MKKSLLYMAAAAALSLGFTACSPDDIADLDPNAVPTMEGVDFTPTVDQETNTLLVHFEKEGCYPVWNVNGTYYSSLPTMTWSNKEKGEYTIELRLANRNGFSKGSIKKTFVFNETKIDYTSIFKKLCDKEWRIDYDEVGHMGCGEPHTDGSNWWAAAPADKKDWGVYDDRITFSNAALKGGTYTYTPGEGGTVYCNKDVATFGQYNTNDGNDYMAPVNAQTTTFTMETGTWSDKDGNVYDCDYITFPEGTLLPYVPNDEALTSNNRWRIEGLTGTRLALVNDNGGIAWRLVFTTRPEAVAFMGFTYDQPDNLWKNATVTAGGIYYADANWTPYPDVVQADIFKVTNQSVSVTLPKATASEWQAQFPLVTDIKPGGVMSSSKTYDFSCVLTSTKAQRVTLKLVETGDNGVPGSLGIAYDANAVFYVGDIKLEPGVPYVFYLVDQQGIDIQDHELQLVMDFGGCEEGTEVNVENIVLIDHAKNTELDKLPSDEPGVDPNAPVMDWDVAAACNLWNAVESGDAFINVTPWFANDGWGQIGDPEWSHKDGVWEIIVPEGMGGSQWQGQFPINTKLTAKGDKKYNFYCVVEADADCPGITIKLTQTDEADGTKHDNNFFFDGRHEVKADVPFVYKAEGVSLKEGTDAHALSLFFDLGGAPAGTTVKVSKIYFDEAMSYDDPNNLWRSVDEGNAFISVTPWFANDGWGQIGDPAWSHAGNEWSLIIPDGMGGSQWQGQFPINTTLTAKGDKAYNFSCIVECDEDCPGVTIKLTQTDEADGTKHDNNFFFDGRHEVKADVPYKYTAKGVTLKEGTDAHALSLFFDFGGTPVGANVKIHDIIFEEAE